MNTIKQDQYWIAHSNAHRLVQKGGGFDSQLGKLFFQADLHNATKLVNAFPEKFLEIGDGPI